MSLSEENEKPKIRVRKRIRKRKRHIVEEVKENCRKKNKFQVKPEPEIDLTCIETFDIECISKDGSFPKGKDGSFPKGKDEIIQISTTFGNADKEYEINLLCDEEFSPEPEDTAIDKKEEKTKPRKMGLPPMCHCVECFAYMGEMNPRQYCRKIYCSYADFGEDELLQTKVFHLRTSPYYTDPDFWGYKDYHDEIQEFIDNNYVEDPDELKDVDDCITQEK